MKTGRDLDQPGRIEITCGSCKNNDDGICDKLGYLLEDDDKPHCMGDWEAKWA